MILRLHPDPEAVQALRERRGWTHEEMADAVWATPLEVSAWEAGTVRVPAVPARRLRELAAVDRYRARLVSQRRTPPCAWASDHAPGLHEILWYEPGQVESNPAVQAHLQDCPTCRQVLEHGRAQRALTSQAEREVSAGHLGYGVDVVPRDLLVVLTGVAGAVLVVAGAALLLALGNRYPGLPSPDSLWQEALAGLVVYALAHWFIAGRLRSRPDTDRLLDAVLDELAGTDTWKLRNPDVDLSRPSWPWRGRGG